MIHAVRAGDEVVEPPARECVLVVDDDVDSADSLAAVMTLLGYAADVAYDGPTALDKARDAKPTAVLCDLGLPGMTGFDLAKALRAGGSGALLVAVTGQVRVEDVEQALAAGFDHHLPKPTSVADLEQVLAGRRRVVEQ